MNKAIRSYLLSILLLAAPAAQAVSLGSVYDTACEGAAALTCAGLLANLLKSSSIQSDDYTAIAICCAVIIYSSRQLHKRFSGTEKTPSDNHPFLHRP